MVNGPCVNGNLNPNLSRRKEVAAMRQRLLRTAIALLIALEIALVTTLEVHIAYVTVDKKELEFRISIEARAELRRP